MDHAAVQEAAEALDEGVSPEAAMDQDWGDDVGPPLDLRGRRDAAGDVRRSASGTTLRGPRLQAFVNTGGVAARRARPSVGWQRSCAWKVYRCRWRSGRRSEKIETPRRR